MAMLTYRAQSVDNDKDKYGRPWQAGTLRIFHTDDRQCWSICLPGCHFYGTAVLTWTDYGGEFYDGQRWQPLKSEAWVGWVDRACKPTP